MKTSNGKTGCFYREKTENTIRFVLEKLRASAICDYIDEVYLYGSAARGTNRFDSDVDFLICLDENYPADLRGNLRLLRVDLMPVDDDLFDTDVHFVIGQQWKREKSIYYGNVLREGVELWQQTA